MTKPPKHRNSRDASIDIRAILTERRQVAIIWSVEDVQCLRPDLTDDQSWEVLQCCEHYHEGDIGLNSTVIECIADDLFPSRRQP